MTPPAPTLREADVKRIAALARLELAQAEIDMFTQQLGDILRYASEIQEIDTAGVPPTSHPFASGPVSRSDEPVPSLDRAVVLEQAPAASPRAGLFKVPKVL